MPKNTQPETNLEQTPTLNTEQSIIAPTLQAMPIVPPQQQTRPPLTIRICDFLAIKQHVFAYTVIIAALVATISLIIYLGSDILYEYFQTIFLSMIFFPILFISLIVIFNASALLAVSAIYTKNPKHAGVFWVSLIPMVVSALSLMISLIYSLCYAFS